MTFRPRSRIPNAVFTASSFTPRSRIRRLEKKYLEISYFKICHCKGDWTPAQFIKEEIEKIRQIVGPSGNVVCGLSGGVDSTVAAVLVHEAIGDRQTCIFVNNGLLRYREFEDTLLGLQEQSSFERTRRRCLGRFLHGIKDVVDPELKRKAIGSKFIDIFDCRGPQDR